MQRAPQASVQAKLPATQLGKDLFSLTDSRYEVLDRETTRLASLMEQLIDSSRVMDSLGSTNKYANKTQNEKDELQLSVTASSMVDACQNLLRLISDVEASYLFLDFNRINDTQQASLKKIQDQNTN